MEFKLVREAAGLLEKANANLEPDLMSIANSRALLADYARIEKLAAYGKAVLATRLHNAHEVAQATGVSLGKAKATVDTGAALAEAGEVEEALKGGAISLDQATEIARAEKACPGVSGELLAVAHEESFHSLRDRARKVVLEAEQHRDLAERQHNSRTARSFSDELGMVHINLALEPHIGAPIVNRAEAEGARLYRQAKKEETPEPFERYLADAYAGMLAGTETKARSRRPELVVLVSHEVAKRGWKDVKEGEVCKIPGVSPISPQVAKRIAQDAFLNGVFFDGTDLRHFARWSREPSLEVRLALELGEPPEFDGVKCVDCGNRFRTERDHLEPHVARGPSSTSNLRWRCYPCHKDKTERDRKAGKLRPRACCERRGPPGNTRRTLQRNRTKHT
jgi:HNH endonuclease